MAGELERLISSWVWDCGDGSQGWLTSVNTLCGTTEAQITQFVTESPCASVAA